MTNEHAYELIDAYVDGALSESDRMAFDQAVAADPALRKEVDAARALKAETAALPRRVEPRRDLWPDIARRIESGERLVDFGRFRGRRPRYGITRYLIAAAAVLALLFGMPVMMNRTVQEPPAAPAQPAMADPELRRIAHEYLEARQQLLDVLQERRDTLTPETRAVVDDNLAVIAAAVEEIETALAADENNRQLQRMLHAAYQSEVHLLRQAVELTEPAEDGAEALEGEHDEA